MKGRTIPGMGIFPGPEDIRNAVLEHQSLEWVASYLDQCDWVQPTRTIIPNHTFAFKQMGVISGILRKLDVKMLDPNSGVNGPRRSRSQRFAA